MGPQLYRCGNMERGAGADERAQASMGPQLYRCGNDDAGAGIFGGDPASMGPQLYRCGNVGTLAAAEVDARASMGPQLYRCGNVLPLYSIQLSRMLASMGPQLYRCGNGRRRCKVTVTALPCFNGAATLSLRKRPYQPYATANIYQLQWGRNFIVAETDRPERRRTVETNDDTGFNGAATLSLRKLSPLQQAVRPVSALQWGRNFIVAETLILRIVPTRFWQLASMGPQLYRCGNCHSRMLSKAFATMLQWGRNFIVAEIDRQGEAARQAVLRFNGAATLSLRKRHLGADNRFRL